MDKIQGIKIHYFKLPTFILSGLLIISVINNEAILKNTYLKYF